MKYQVLLYYHYTSIENPETFAETHLKYCKNLGVFGRIIISKEGINGTLSGTVEQTETYMKDLKAISGFQEISFKSDLEEFNPFRRISIKVKNEIVTLDLEVDINPHEITGKFLEPKEYFKKLQA